MRDYKIMCPICEIEMEKQVYNSQIFLWQTTQFRRRFLKIGISARSAVTSEDF